MAMWTYLKLFLTAVFWGGTFIAGRIVAATVGPFSAAFLRFAIATACLLVLTRIREKHFPRLEPRQVAGVVLLGLTGIFAYNGFFFAGLALIAASRASLIIACNPVLITVLSAWIFGERLGPLHLAGTLMSVTGAIVVITRGNPMQVWEGGIGTGEMMIFGCVASWVAYSLIGKVLLKGLSPLTTVTYAALSGMLMLLPAAWINGLAGDLAACRLQDWLSLAYLGILGTVVGFVWYYQGIMRIGAGPASLFINFVPVSAIVMAYLILHEPVTASLVVGAVLVGTGVYLTCRPPSRRDLSASGSVSLDTH
jgi:drug/metabolite transporter (DMT)-like permease